MLTTLKLLALVKKTHSNCSDYRAAQLMGISTKTPNKWETRGSVMDDETAIKAAVLCKLDVEYVLACIAAERVKNSPSATYWKHIAQRMEPAKIAA